MTTISPARAVPVHSCPLPAAASATSTAERRPRTHGAQSFTLYYSSALFLPFYFFLLSSPQSSHGRRVLSIFLFSVSDFPPTAARPPFYFLSIFSFSPAAPVLRPPHAHRLYVFYFVYTSYFRRSVSSYFILYGLHANRMILYIYIYYVLTCAYINIYIYTLSITGHGDIAAANRRVRPAADLGAYRTAAARAGS